MKLLKEITDKEILGTDGLSEVKPRYKSRAILYDDNNLFAVVYFPEFKLYSLPGGGIEEGESELEAVKREILEETGYHCEIVRELGYVYENRAHCDFTQYSYYYVAKIVGKQEETSLNEDERNSEMQVQWHSIEDAIHFITSPIHDTIQRKFIQAKDTAALNEFVRINNLDLNKELSIEKGTLQDVDELEKLYDDLNDFLASHINYPGWKKNVYPARNTAVEGIVEGNLFVARSEGKIVGTVILRHRPESAYALANWHTDWDYSEILVIYTLAVHPKYLNKHVGKQIMDYILDYARQIKIKAIRLDVYQKNTPAIRLYESCGFQYIDTVDLGYSEYGLDLFKLYQRIM